MLSLFIGVTVALVVGSASADASASQSKTPDNQDYTLAYKQSVEEDKPLMVVVSASYCPACEVLKKTTIANMTQSGELDAVSVAVVDRDAQPELAKQLMVNEGMVPQIIVFSKSQNGRWNRKLLKGYQPIQPVRSLIRSIVGRG